jgi:hypothetical protein
MNNLKEEFLHLLEEADPAVVSAEPLLASEFAELLADLTDAWASKASNLAEKEQRVSLWIDLKSTHFAEASEVEAAGDVDE